MERKRGLGKRKESVPSSSLPIHTEPEFLQEQLFIGRAHHPEEGGGNETADPLVAMKSDPLGAAEQGKCVESSGDHADTQPQAGVGFSPRKQTAKRIVQIGALGRTGPARVIGRCFKAT